MANGNDTPEDEKTEEPTQQRLEDSRKEGNVAQSKEITAFLVLLACVGTVYFGGSGLLDIYFNSFREFSNLAGTMQVNSNTIGKLMMLTLESIVKIVAPIACIGFVAGVAGTVVQVGVNFSWKPIEPNIEKLNPVSGFRRIFSMNSLVEGVKSVFKLIAVGSVAYFMAVDSVITAPVLIEFESVEIVNYMGIVGFRLIGAISLALFVIAGFDLGWQKFRHYKSLRMTKQEIKDELKNREGDPLLKARVRSIQRERAQRRMMEQVPKADVIVTNPTHIAVALKYDAENMDAPKIVAKGADYIALKIKEIARENNIPTVENVPLARALHKSVKVGQYIPRALYQSVAEVLAYIYRMGRRK